MKARFPEYPDLWRRLRLHGCQEARRELIERHRRLVPGMVQRHPTPDGIERADLESEDYLSLVKSVDSYEPERGRRFVSYAAERVRWAWQEYLRQESWGKQAGRTDRRNGTRPLHLVSLCELLHLDEDDWCEGESLFGYWPDYDAAVIRDDTKTRLWSAVGHLPPRAAAAFRYFYLGELRTVDIAAKLGRSESRVSQYLKAGRVELRGRLLELAGDVEEAAVRARVVEAGG